MAGPPEGEEGEGEKEAASRIKEKGRKIEETALTDCALPGGDTNLFVVLMCFVNVFHLVSFTILV